MATEDKAAHKVTELKGKAKEVVGDVTGDQELQAEGQADQAEGKVKQAGDKVKDAGGKIKDAVTGD
ncbi:MAG TPA: CsbD family protein [Trebonia sp.]